MVPKKKILVMLAGYFALNLLAAEPAALEAHRTAGSQVPPASASR